MHDTCAGVDVRDILLRESFNLVNMHSLGNSQLFCVHRVPVISGVVVLEEGMTETKEGMHDVLGGRHCGGKVSIGIDASPARGGVLGVV